MSDIDEAFAIAAEFVAGLDEDGEPSPNRPMGPLDQVRIARALLAVARAAVAWSAGRAQPRGGVLPAQGGPVTDRVMWFARGGEFARLGPFDSQIAAVNAMRLSPDERARTGQEFPDNVFVWPEVVRTLKEAP